MDPTEKARLRGNSGITIYLPEKGEKDEHKKAAGNVFGPHGKDGQMQKLGNKSLYISPKIRLQKPLSKHSVSETDVDTPEKSAAEENLLFYTVREHEDRQTNNYFKDCKNSRDNLTFYKETESHQTSFCEHIPNVHEETTGDVDDYEREPKVEKRNARHLPERKKCTTQEEFSKDIGIRPIYKKEMNINRCCEVENEKLTGKQNYCDTATTDDRALRSKQDSSSSLLIIQNTDFKDCVDGSSKCLVPVSQRKLSGRTLYLSCYSDRLISIHELRSTIHSCLGGSWSIINPDECKRVCFYCFNKVRVETTDDLGPGDHIAFARALGYEHHAIVVEVSPASEDKTVGNLRVIHRSANVAEATRGILLYILTLSLGGEVAYLREENLNINFKKQDVYVIQYKNKPFTRSGVVRRARAELNRAEKESFHIFRDNCEHFATFCATGEYFSTQIGLIKATLSNLLITDNDGYNNMLQYLLNNNLLCEDCYKNVKKANSECRLST